MRKSQALLRQLIDVGRFNDGMSGRAQRVVSPVIRQQNQHIHGFLRGGSCKGGKQARQKNGAGGEYKPCFYFHGIALLTAYCVFPAAQVKAQTPAPFTKATIKR
jgi:hypothetical protein